MKSCKFVFILSLIILIIFSISAVSAAEDVGANTQISSGDLQITNNDFNDVNLNNDVNDVNDVNVVNVVNVNVDNVGDVDNLLYVENQYGNLSIKIDGSYYKSSKLVVNFTDDEGIPFVGEKIGVTFSNGKYVTLTTNSNGMATYNIPFAVGTYNVGVSSLNGDILVDDVFSKFTIKKSVVVVSASSVSTSFKSGKYFNVKLVDSKKNPVVNAKIKLKVYTGSKYVTVYVYTNTVGVAKYACSGLGVGTHNVVVSSGESSKNLVLSPNTLNRYVKISKVSAKVSASSVSASFREDKSFNVKLVDSKKNPIVDASLKLKIYDGKKYTVAYIYTDTKGIARYSCSGLSVGDYKVVVSSGESSKNLVLSPNTLNRFIEITKAKTTLSIEDRYVGDNGGLKIYLKSGDNPLYNKVVKLNIGGKNYSNRTDGDGVATFNIEGEFKEYSISSIFRGDSCYLSSSLYSTIEFINGSNGYWVNNFTELYDALEEIKSSNFNSKYYILLNGNNYISNETLYADLDGKILTIAGNNPYLTCKISGNGAFSFINVGNDDNLILENIILNNFKVAIFNNGTLTIDSCNMFNNTGVEGSCIFNNIYSTLEVRDSKFNDNTANLGAVIYCDENVNSIILNSKFNNNIALSDAGAIYNSDNSNLTLIGNQFNNNYAKTNGGAVWNRHNLVSRNNQYYNNSVYLKCGGAIYNRGNASLISFNDTFEGNNVNYTGGAIHSQNSYVFIENDTFINNFARDVYDSNGGALCNYENGEMIVKYSEFKGNYVNNRGGSIVNYDYSNLTLIENIFEDNSADEGGSIYNYENGYANIVNNKFIDNSASNGGALYVDSAVDISDSYFLDNSASNGGAIYSVSVVGISDSYFLDNSASNGGALYVDSDSSMNVTNSNFTFNVAYSCGGAIDVETDGTLYLYSSKFNSNKASSDGGSVYNWEGNLYLYDNEFINSSGTDGGTICNYYEAVMYAKGNKFINSSAEIGGAIQNYAHKRSERLIVYLYDNLFENCVSMDGGAIYNYNMTSYMINNTFINNYANNSGGAISNEALVDINSSNNYFENNYAFNGGAISNIHTILNSTNDVFLNNKAIVGCGLFIDNSTIDMVNATFIGNNNTDIESYALFTIDASDVSISVSNESMDDLSAKKLDKVIDSIFVPKSYVDADENGIYTLTNEQYQYVIQIDSYFLYLKHSLPKYVYFQDITGTWYKLSREKWNIIEKAVNTKCVLINSMDKPNTITVDLNNKSCTYTVVRDQQNTDFDCGPTSLSITTQTLKGYIAESILISGATCTYQDGSVTSGLKRGIELMSYYNESYTPYSAELIYGDQFSYAIDELAKGNSAIVFHTTSHYVAIVDVYENESGRYLQLVNPSGDYNHGSHDLPTNWLSEEYVYEHFAPYDASALIIRLNYNLSDNVIGQLNELYDDLGGKWDNDTNIGERISDIGM